MDALPEKMSIAEGLACKHWDITGFATSILNLMSFCIYLTGQRSCFAEVTPL